MPRSSQDLRKKILGKVGEKAVEEYLKERGYQVLYRNYSTPFGEADLIVEDFSRGEIAFVEVKTRSSDAYGTPAEAVVKKSANAIKKSPPIIG